MKKIRVVKDGYEVKDAYLFKGLTSKIYTSILKFHLLIHRQLPIFLYSIK
ncbi:hypothetical protein ACFVSZ_25705 [Priestia megaterium]